MQAAATDKQVAYIVRLHTERGKSVTADDFRSASKQDASRIISALLATPRPKPVTAVPVTEPGMYRGPDGAPVRVQKSRDSDRLYAKRLVKIGGERLTDADDVVRFEFQYAPGLLFSLKPDDRMTLDEAKAFGIRYGVCCVCGAFLKDATSVANGIGTVCAGKV